MTATDIVRATIVERAETAEVLEISTGTVKREWAVAKAWLYRELAGDTPASAPAPEE